MTKEKAVATTQEAAAGAVALPEDMVGIFDIKDNMKGVLPRLPQIDIVHKAQMFKFPDGSKKENFTGILLQKQFCNAWWEVDYDKSGGGAPPDCSSLDAITPDYNSPKPQCDKCAKCSLNKFGSDGDRGKACKNMVRCHIMMDGDPTPYRLTLSPANIRPINDYISTVSLKGRPYQLIYTNFSLAEAASKGGITYSQLVMKDMGLITDRNIAMALKHQMDQWMPAFVGQAIEAGENE